MKNAVKRRKNQADLSNENSETAFDKLYMQMERPIKFDVIRSYNYWKGEIFTTCNVNAAVDQG